MKDRTGIDPLSITDGKISNQAKISPKKIAPADEASFMIAQADKKYQPKTIHGDGTIDANGKLTITSSTSTNEESFTESDRQKLDSIQSGAGVNPTADEVRELLRDNPGEIQSYQDAGNLEPGKESSITTTSSGLPASTASTAGTTQAVPLQMITATATSGSSNTTDYIVEHNLGSLPVSVQVLEDDGNGNLEEIETEVVSTNTNTTIKFTKPNMAFTAKIIGAKP
tara:strand:- start:43 stop:720 length:678 start_codon:yes stop_codon:yes gene_type:complete